MLREAVDARPVPYPQCERNRARRAAEARPRGRGRRAHEAPGRKDVEGAIALAHEVRRRRQPGLVRDAPAGEERDVPATDEPPRRIRRVAGVCILGQEDEQPAAEPPRGARRRSGSTGPETRADVGNPRTKDWNRSCRRSSSTNAASGVASDVLIVWSCSSAGSRSRGVIVLALPADSERRTGVAGSPRPHPEPRSPNLRPTAQQLSAQLPQGHPRCPDVTLARKS